MEMKHVLFHVAGLPVSLYAVCIVASLAVGLLALYLNQRREGLREETTEIFALLALPLGLLGARAFYCLARLSLYMEIGAGSIFRLWEGGYALWGVIGGAALAAVLTAKITHQSALKLLDTMAAPGALVIALSRMAEMANGEGIGMEVWDPMFQRFPFAVFNADYEVWFWAVFVLEALVAAAIACVLLSRKLCAMAPGSRAKAFVVFYCSAQILLESLRRDGFLRWLFVRVSQLTAVLVLAALMFWALYRWVMAPADKRMAPRTLIVNWVIFVVGVGVSIGMEFAVDKSAYMPVWLCYTLMAICCVAFGWTSYQLILKGVAAEEA